MEVDHLFGIRKIVFPGFRAMFHFHDCIRECTSSVRTSYKCTSKSQSLQTAQPVPNQTDRVRKAAPSSPLRLRVPHRVWVHPPSLRPRSDRSRSGSGTKPSKSQKQVSIQLSLDEVGIELLPLGWLKSGSMYMSA